MLIVHWENLSFPLCVKWKAFLPQCECVIVSRACVLIPSHSTWTAFPPSPEDSRALPCWARRFCSLSQSGNGMWWKKSEGEKKEKLVLFSHQLMAVKIIWTESCSFCWKSFCPRVFYSTTRYLLGAVQFDLGERKCLLCSAFVVFSVPQSSWSYFAEAFFLPCCGFH